MRTKMGGGEAEESKVGLYVTIYPPGPRLSHILYRTTEWGSLWHPPFTWLRSLR